MSSKKTKLVYQSIRSTMRGKHGMKNWVTLKIQFQEKSKDQDIFFKEKKVVMGWRVVIWEKNFILGVLSKFQVDK